VNNDVRGTFGSAKDIPQIRELGRLIDGAWRIRFLLKSAQRQKLEQLKAELSNLSSVVDKFYDLLGNRNWVFHGDMSMPAMGEVVAMETPEQAELRLIDYYKDEKSLDSLIGRLWRVEALRHRQNLIIQASEDYRAGRYYSTVLVLIPVMDGAVNDLEPHNRRGLHTREDHEMVAWDSVTAHHLGLKNAHRSFTKTFKKTVTDEVTELHRHGIVHGMIVNYDNVVVATKAFNRLFAIADWAMNILKEPEQEPKRTSPTPKELFNQLVVARWSTKALENFQAFSQIVNDQDTHEDEVVQKALGFLKAWSQKNYMEVSQVFLTTDAFPEPPHRRAATANELYQRFHLTDYQIKQVRHEAASVAFVEVDLTVNDEPVRARLRWLFADSTGGPAIPGVEGNWRLAPHGPTAFLEKHANSQPPQAVHLKFSGAGGH